VGGSLLRKTILFFNKIATRTKKELTTVPPVVLLCLCLFITAASASITQTLLDREETALFEKKVKSISLSIETRLKIYTNALIATQALFKANKFTDRNEFGAFISGFNLRTQYPGMHGIGYTLKVSQKDLPAHVRQIQTSGLPDYRPWPQSNESELFSIIYIEPLDWRNKRALGYNMHSDPIRRKAMDQARDSGEAATTGLVTLVQETSEKTQPGFLIYVPIYKKNMPVSSFEERRKALEGFVYSPFRAQDLFAQIQKDLLKDDSSIIIKVFDGNSELEKDLLFSSQDEKQKSLVKYRHERSLPLLIADHPWTLKIQAAPENHLNWWELSPLFVGILGSIISFLIFYIHRFSKTLNINLKEDLKRQKNTQERVREAQILSEQANQTKSRFLAAITHEIRTPLGIILGFADLALDAKGINEEVRDYLVGIKRNGNSLLNLIGDVLDLSKIEANKMEMDLRQVPLHETLDDVISSLNLLAREKGLNLKLIKDEPLPTFISTDPLRFRQILINLIGNAIKFTEKGEVSLRVRGLSKPVVGSPIHLEFLIQDSGIGIVPEFKKTIFQPFSQGESLKSQTHRGTGLGLALSKQLAIALGGDAELVHSEVGKGSTFRFYINGGLYSKAPIEKEPKKTDAHRNSTSLSSQTLPPLEGVNILVAEDSSDNQLLIKRYLTSAGARIDFANDGLEALSMANKKDYSVILMDIQMPNLDGYEATQRLRKEGYKKKIIALTANAFREERERILSGGFDQYLTKPISRINLIKEISAILFKENDSQG
jgi:signal transduction histidine kinase/CheY-like chemotaxis protein